MGGGGGGGVETRTYYKYTVHFLHTGIEPSKPIYLYNQYGAQIMVISPYDSNVNYAKGEWQVPGDQQNSTVENISSAGYWVNYGTDALKIDYERVEFKINKRYIRDINQELVTATFDYRTTITSVDGIDALIDGNYDTQVQTVFYAQPPQGYNYAIIDLGSEQEIQAIDLLAGFFYPTEGGIRKFDINNTFTIEYSLDGVLYYPMGADATNFKLSGGEAISFEEETLGANFTARYLKIIVEHAERVNYGTESNQYLTTEGKFVDYGSSLLPTGTLASSKNYSPDQLGIWVIAFTELGIYQDLVLRGEAKLIPTTYTTALVPAGSVTIPVISTKKFDDSGSAYINEYPFDYTGKTDTSFTGVTGLPSGTSFVADTRVTQDLESDTTMYDPKGLLQKVGDVVRKDTSINEYLNNQTLVDRRAIRLLEEFYKNHDKVQVRVMFAPHLQLGQTVTVNDTLNGVSQNYFIEGIEYSSDGFFNLTLARYE